MRWAWKVGHEHLGKSIGLARGTVERYSVDKSSMHHIVRSMGLRSVLHLLIATRTFAIGYGT